MQKSRYYLIAGTGNASANVIETGLNDVVLTTKEFVVLWTGKPTDGQSRVYDWLIEHSASFTVVHADAKVHHLVEGAANRVLKVDNLIDDSLDSYPEATVLVLWDEVATLGQPTQFVEDIVITANQKGMETLDLCNGLVPLTVGEPVEDKPSEASRKPQDASKKSTLPPTQDSVSKASNDDYALSYVKDGKLAFFIGPKASVLKFLSSE
jgi:hypothetical protein